MSSLFYKASKQLAIAPSPNNARGATLSALEQFQLPFFKNRHAE